MFTDKISKDFLLSTRANNNLAIQRILKDKTNIINPNLQDETGKTVLHYAVKNINLFIIRSIFENKNNNIVQPNINIQDNNGYTVLHYLAKTINNLKFASIDGSFYDSDNYIILQILLNNNINVDIQDYKENTALHYTIYNSNLFFIKELLIHDANPFILNKAKISILDYLNIKELDFKNEVIEILYSKYPNSIDLLKINNKIIVYNLPYFMNENNSINPNEQMLLGDSETFENINNDAYKPF